MATWMRVHEIGLILGGVAERAERSGSPARCPSRAAIPTPDRTLPEPATPNPRLQGRADARPVRQTLARRVPGAAFGGRFGGVGTPPGSR